MKAKSKKMSPGKAVKMFEKEDKKADAKLEKKLKAKVK